MRRAQRVRGAKVLWGAIVIGILMSPWASIRIKGEDEQSYFIEGYVFHRETEIPVADVDITLINQRTEEPISTSSDDNGWYQLNLDNFQQGWQFGDEIRLEAFKVNYLPYISIIIVGQDWPSNHYYCQVNLPIPDPNPSSVTNPWGPDTGGVDFILQFRWGSGCSLQFYWDNSNNFILQVPDNNPPYDGVRIVAYYQISDDGQWVPYGETYYIELNFTLKITLDAPERILYGPVTYPYNYT